MRNIKLDKKKINIEKLESFGFILQNSIYKYEENILDSKMKIEVFYNGEKLYSKVIDNNTNEEYILVDIENAYGSFVGKIKNKYEEKINYIVDSITECDIFKNAQSKDVQNYIKEKYNVNLEYPWHDENAIARHKDNQKWFLALLYCKNSYFNNPDDAKVEIINLKNNNVQKIVDNAKIFPAYHMNKKCWITIKLDGTLDNQNLFKLIDESFNLTK